MTKEHAHELRVDCLSPEVRENFPRLMNEHQLGKYEKFFLLNFTDRRRIKRVFSYGLGQLPDEEHRPDLDLATYFYILSGIEYLRHEVKVFATEAMTYCEYESGSPTWTRETVKAEYEKIKHLIE